MTSFSGILTESDGTVILDPAAGRYQFNEREKLPSYSEEFIAPALLSSRLISKQSIVLKVDERLSFQIRCPELHAASDSTTTLVKFTSYGAPISQ